MKKVIVIPDSFKGSVSSIEFCEIADNVISEYFPEAEVVTVPVADGGEGSVDCFLHCLSGERVNVRVKGPLFETVDSFYGIINNGKTAVIEMAAASGLPLVMGRENPMAATTYGVGELIAHAVKKGCTEIMLGLGGSATNDGGTGCAFALGVDFFDKDGNKLHPSGENLIKIADYDDTKWKKLSQNIKITCICDIDNPFYGPEGAAFVFAPQKGADRDMVSALDAGLKNLADVILRKTGIDIQSQKGSGAAGGMGGGCSAILGAELKKGIECVLDTVGFNEKASDADLIITGEGKIDSQSLRGKVVIGIAKRAKALQVPLIAVVGDIGDNMEPAYEMGVSAIYSINRVAVPFTDARLRSKDDLKLTLDTIMRSAGIFKRIYN